MAQEGGVKTMASNQLFEKHTRKEVLYAFQEALHC